MSGDDEESTPRPVRRRRKCVCRLEHCAGQGFEGSISLPTDPVERQQWLTQLGWGLEQCTLSDPRVGLAHFPDGSLVAPTTQGKKIGDGTERAAVSVCVGAGSSPDISNDAMATASRGALERALRAEALNRTYAHKVEAQETRILKLEAKLARGEVALQGTTAKLAQERERTRAPLSKNVAIDYTILDTLSPSQSRAMCGMPDLACFEALYVLVDDEGAAKNMDYYGEKEDAGGERAKRRARDLGCKNGLFFALFVIRTGSTLTVASALFGVSKQTAGRAFTTWVCFLRRSLRPFVRFPKIDEVEATAPPNFIRAGLGKCILVLDGVELETMRVWQANMAHVIWSPYKGRPTGKLMVAVTSGGAITYIGPMYGGRLSDSDIVKRSGLIEGLVKMGYSGKGFSVMADRGFNPLAASFLEAGILYVAPPSTRTGEEQFTTEDADISREVANLRIHVERAIGALKEWRYLDTKFSSKQMDVVPMVWEICASLVNMLRPPFASAT